MAFPQPGIEAPLEWQSNYGSCQKRVEDEDPSQRVVWGGRRTISGRMERVEAEGQTSDLSPFPPRPAPRPDHRQ